MERSPKKETGRTLKCINFIQNKAIFRNLQSNKIRKMCLGFNKARKSTNKARNSHYDSMQLWFSPTTKKKKHDAKNTTVFLNFPKKKKKIKTHLLGDLKISQCFVWSWTQPSVSKACLYLFSCCRKSSKSTKKRKNKWYLLTQPFRSVLPH